MKKIIITCLFIVGLSTTISAQEKLKINKTKSSVHWFGYYTFYFGGHDGTIKLNEGYFINNPEFIN